MAGCKSCNIECGCDDRQIKVSFCPKCKSRDVKHVFELGNLFGILPKMRCKKCGNEMVVFPVLVTSKKILEESEKSKKDAAKRKTMRKKK
ncbi:MAG: hypothetical protein OEL87_02860 [Nanoarchaeota archaeon]|nr:hypothetical protein [Nanoarchaeota archaeon]